MPATQLSRELHALCHEHHVKMRLSLILLQSEDKDAQVSWTWCPASDVPLTECPWAC